MALRDTAIVAYSEAKNVVRSGRDVWDFAAEIVDSLLRRSGLERGDVDGLILGPSLTGASTAFWQQSTLDFLGLEVDFADTTDLGGCSAAGSVARAAAAIEAGLCSVVVLINADAPSTDDQLKMRAFNTEWTDPHGLFGPPGAFGLLSQRYRHQYGLDDEALAQLAVTQRTHALLNPNAVEKLKRPLTRDEYLSSRMISDPLRLLDCVMPCDGANGFLMMSAREARRRGFARFVLPIGYGERSNYRADRNDALMTESGHRIAGQRAFAQAQLGPRDIGSLHLYDDFLIALLITMEMMGFCDPGQGSRFVRDRSFLHDGDVPLNTSGGQISAGQPGLAGGGLNLVEAVRQLFGEGGARQVRNTSSALVTGIGWIPYGRNWGSSNVLILAPDG
jgi:acetyl-CoA acetyltransferase